MKLKKKFCLVQSPKYIVDGKIIKTIFVKNKIINYIIEKWLKNFYFFNLYFLFTSCGFKVVEIENFKLLYIKLHLINIQNKL